MVEGCLKETSVCLNKNSVNKEVANKATLVAQICSYRSCNKRAACPSRLILTSFTDRFLFVLDSRKVPSSSPTQWYMFLFWSTTKTSVLHLRTWTKTPLKFHTICCSHHIWPLNPFWMWKWDLEKAQSHNQRSKTKYFNEISIEQKKQV